MEIWRLLAAWLTSRTTLWLLFIVNLLGSIYGYMWYGNQLRYTWEQLPLWTLPFVPDSPTASLFFTFALLGLLLSRTEAPTGHLLNLVAAFGTVTCFKYGIWAVAMIVASGWQGDALVWQDWMLIGSHLGMAVQAVLFAGMFAMRRGHIALILLWMLLNDVMDYHGYKVFPWLPSTLLDDLAAVEWFTISLSLVSAVAVAWAARLRLLR